MALSLDAQRSVDTLHAYLIAYARSLDEDDRAQFSARVRSDAGFAHAILETLRTVHDAMVSCLSEVEPAPVGRVARLLESESMVDPELSKAAIYTLAKFSPAIVMDLDAESALSARARLVSLLDKARARVAAVKVH